MKLTQNSIFFLMILFLSIETHSMVFTADPQSKTFVEPRRSIHVVDKNTQDPKYFRKTYGGIGVIKVTYTYDRRPLDKWKAEDRRNWTPETTASTMANGFMINECLMMTNKHVVMESSYYSSNSRNTIEVSVGPGTNINISKLNQFAPKARAHVVAYSDFDQVHNQNYNDFAIIRLNRNLGATYGYLELDSKNPIRELKSNGFVLIGAAYHPDYIPTHITGQVCTGAKFKDRPYFMTSCPAPPGVSGSPVFKDVLDKNGNFLKLVVIGITSATSQGKAYLYSATPYSFTHYNILNMIPNHIGGKTIEQIKKENPCY